MHHSQKKVVLLQYLTIALLLLALAFRAGATFEWLFPKEDKPYTLNDVQKAFPEATTFQNQNDRSIAVFDKDKHKLGRLLCSTDFESTQHGYNGDVPLFIAISPDEHITQIVLLANQESEEFMGTVIDAKLFEAWNGMPIDSLAPQKQVDAVSGATFSSSAIIVGVQQTISSYLQIKHEQGINWAKIIQLLAVCALISSALIQLFSTRFKGFYYYHLVLVFLIMGLWLKKMFSIELFFAWLGSGIPWQSNAEMFIILLLTLLMSMAGKRNFYCNYLCPMGAIQLLVSKISPFKKKQFPKQLLSIDLRLIYLCFIWSILLIGISLPLGNMEPFIAFIYHVASWSMICFGLLFVVLSLFFNRPWCALCPTGCALNITKPLITKSKKNPA
ncbi:MAG: 4Fe-4S binding protein [Mangrovibacterium sp.]